MNQINFHFPSFSGLVQLRPKDQRFLHGPGCHQKDMWNVDDKKFWQNQKSSRKVLLHLWPTRMCEYFRLRPFSNDVTHEIALTFKPLLFMKIKLLFETQIIKRNVDFYLICLFVVIKAQLVFYYEGFKLKTVKLSY